MEMKVYVPVEIKYTYIILYYIEIKSSSLCSIKNLV